MTERRPTRRPRYLHSFALSGFALGVTFTVSCASQAAADLGAQVPTPSVIAASSPGPRQLPPAIEDELRAWSRNAGLLRAAQVGLSLVAIVASLLVATHVGGTSITPERLKWIAFASALATGLLSALDPGGEANRMRNAWRILNTAVIRYQIGTLDVKDVITAYERGESRIGDYTVEVKRENSENSVPDAP